MQITIDTREPLTKVLPVIQAAYQVTLTIGPAGEDNPASSPTPRRRPRRAGSKRQAGKSPARKPATNGGTSRAARAASNAQVRAWARDNGHQVSDTGRIPAVVLDAYRNAH